jgi:hypothetical protein
MVNADSTVEQLERYAAALEREKDGYEFRVAGLKTNPLERLDEAALKDRAKQVDAESKRVAGLLRKAKRGDDAEASDAGDDTA